jgi:hypothetical protein
MLFRELNQLYIDIIKDVAMDTGKRKMTPEKAVEMMKKQGTMKSPLEEAELMLDFLYRFAKLTLEIVLKR